MGSVTLIDQLQKIVGTFNPSSKAWNKKFEQLSYYEWTSCQQHRKALGEEYYEEEPTEETIQWDLELAEDMKKYKYHIEYDPKKRLKVVYD